jgi:hypothetical protein
VTFLVHRSAHSAARRTPATASPRVSPTPIPPGFARGDGAEGSTLAVPDGWVKQVLPGGSVKWTEPGTGAYVQVDSIPWDVADPVEHWRRLEREVTAKNRLPGYRRLRLGHAFTYRGWRGADLEYTWNSTSYGRLRGYDRGFTANRHQYAILVAAPAARWSHYAGFVGTAFDWFAPAA